MKKFVWHGIKVGDKVKCISNRFADGSDGLTIGKFYRINKIIIQSNVNLYEIKNDVGILQYYYIERFINITEERRIKLNKLNGI